METYCGDWDDPEYSTKCRQFYEESSTENLIEIAEDGEYVLDVVIVLSTLHKRDAKIAIELAKSIIKNKKGDWIMRNDVRGFLKEAGIRGQYWLREEDAKSHLDNAWLDW